MSQVGLTAVIEALYVRRRRRRRTQRRQTCNIPNALKILTRLRSVIGQKAVGDSTFLSRLGIEKGKDLAWISRGQTSFTI